MLRIAAALGVSALMLPGLAAALQAQQQITGSIGFGALSISLSGGTSLATATSFAVTGPFISSESGSYSGVPLSTPMAFNGFQIDPPPSAVTPLWTFTLGDVNYSFDATSVSDTYIAPLHEWNIGGNGIAMISGYAPTEGQWNVNLSQSGASVVFDSSAGVSPVPEPNSEILLFGGGVIGMLGILRRRGN